MANTYTNSAQIVASGTAQTPKAVSADRSFTQSDDGLVLEFTGAFTLTMPAGLRIRVHVIPPASGNASIAFSGTTGNGASTTITRTRATNPGGFTIIPYIAANAYGVSGS